jgi:hypothetical protein
MKLKTGVTFNVLYSNNRPVIELPAALLSRMTLHIPTKNERDESYDRFKIQGNGPIALFLEADATKIYQLDFPSYRVTTERIFLELKKRGFSVVLKPHPRLGSSAFVSAISDQVLDSAIPAEFLDLPKGNRLMALGLSSTSLGIFADRGIPSVAIVKLYAFASPEEMNRHITYASNGSSRVRLVEDFESLLRIFDEVATSASPN